MNSETRLAGITAISSAVLMLIGAALQGASGTDLWGALADGKMAEYLPQAAKAKTILTANHSFWILGVFVMGLAGSLIIEQFEGRQTALLVALNCYRIAVPMAILAFLGMQSMAQQLVTGTPETQLALAEVVGWISARADDIATALLIGVAPLFISIAGRKNGLPDWLVIWGHLAGLTGLIALLVLFTPGMWALGFLVLPVGIGWLIALGIVFLRKK